MKSSVVIKGITLVAALSVLGRGASARWLSPDPLYHTLGKEALERPFDAANPYTYAGNNPINATDPSGLCPWCLVGLGAAALLFIQNDVDANIAPALALTPPGALAIGVGMFADATDQIDQLDRQRAALLAAGNTGPASEARLAALNAGIREAGAQAFFGLATAGVGAGPLREAGAARGIPQALGRGSTANLSKGTTLARNLREQLAIEQAMASPGAGAKLPLKMTDPRWPGSEGWGKMQQVIESGGREGPINVHYLFNEATGAIDDFKIVLPGPR